MDGGHLDGRAHTGVGKRAGVGHRDVVQAGPRECAGELGQARAGEGGKREERRPGRLCLGQNREGERD